MEHFNPDQATRRGLLKQLSTAAAVTAFPILGQNPPPESHHTSAPITKQAATAYRFRYFRKKQLRTLDALVETIIPADEHSPGARAAGVSEYIDAIVADASTATQRLWTEGLKYVDHAAKNAHGHHYAECAPADQIAILREIAGNEESPKTEPEQFFRACKRLTIDGYYTSKIGIHQELEYRGNEALREFPGCTEQETP